MTKKERKLLGSAELNKLYEITDPKLNQKPTLHIVICYNGSEWKIEDSHILRGYRACKRTLESKVSRYEADGVWPNQCQIGIGLFVKGCLQGVLIARNLGVKPVSNEQPTLPLDDALNAIGLSRKDVM